MLRTAVGPPSSRGFCGTRKCISWQRDGRMIRQNAHLKNYILNAFAVAEVPSVGASSGARELAVREPGKFPRAQIGGSEDLAPRKQPKRVSYRATRKRKTSMTPSQVRSRRERHGAETDRQVSNNLQPRRTFLTREETHEACLTWKKACAAQRAIESVAGPDAFADLNALGQVQRSRICEAIEADSWEEVTERLDKGRKAGSMLWAGFKRLVFKQAHQYVPQGARGDFHDVVQAGFDGLLLAAERFDPARADALSTVATLYIKQSVMRATHRMARPIHVPYNHLDLSNRVRRTSALLESRLGREPTMEEVAREVGMSEDKVRASMRAMRMQRYLEDVAGNREKGTTGEASQAQADEVLQPWHEPGTEPEYLQDPAEKLIRDNASRRINSDISQLLDVLSPEQAEAIRRRYGIESRATAAPPGGTESAAERSARRAPLSLGRESRSRPAAVREGALSARAARAGAEEVREVVRAGRGVGGRGAAGDTRAERGVSGRREDGKEEDLEAAFVEMFGNGARAEGDDGVRKRKQKSSRYHARKGLQVLREMVTAAPGLKKALLEGLAEK